MFKFICYASFDASLGEKLFTLILDPESAFEEHDFSFSCQVVGEAGLILFRCNAAVLSVLGEDGIVKGIVRGANAHQITLVVDEEVVGAIVEVERELSSSASLFNFNQTIYFGKNWHVVDVLDDGLAIALEGFVFAAVAHRYIT